MTDPIYTKQVKKNIYKWPNFRKQQNKWDSKIEIYLERVENIVRKGQSAGISFSSLTHSVFKSPFFQGG